MTMGRHLDARVILWNSLHRVRIACAQRIVDDYKYDNRTYTSTTNFFCSPTGN